MNGRIRRCAPYLLKRFATPAAAEAAVLRTDLLRRAGVQTARAVTKAGSRLVRFDLIEASTGLDMLLRQGNALLPAMMQSLAALHAVKHLAHLHPYEPLQKITPRLSEADHPVFTPILNQALAELRDLPGETCVIHGDLHANQFLVDRNGACWVIDFDDLALGDPAADLGNFAAHLATRPETGSGEPLTSMRQWLSLVLDAYGAAGGIASARGADAYGRIALVRRVLKLRETQVPERADKPMAALSQAS